jgi:hypothetical protein
MWVWDAGTRQLVIGVPRTGILPHVHITYLSYTAASSLCCFAHNPLLLYDAMCYEACTVPCAGSQDVAHDGRPCREQTCFTNGNPEPQPSCLTLDVAASLVHALQRS